MWALQRSGSASEDSRLATDEKHYLGDHGIVHALFGYSDRRLPGVLENIVWLELRRRGYDVTVGKIGPTEVDFAARRQEDTIYTSADPGTGPGRSRRHRRRRRHAAPSRRW
jgi:uncharacterized protein